MKRIVFAFLIASLGLTVPTAVKAQVPERVMFQPATFGHGNGGFVSPQPLPNQLILRPVWQQKQLINPYVTPYGSHAFITPYGHLRAMPNSYPVRTLPPNYYGEGYIEDYRGLLPCLSHVVPPEEGSGGFFGNGLGLLGNGYHSERYGTENCSESRTVPTPNNACFSDLDEENGETAPLPEFKSDRLPGPVNNSKGNAPLPFFPGNRIPPRTGITKTVPQSKPSQENPAPGIAPIPVRPDDIEEPIPVEPEIIIDPVTTPANENDTTLEPKTTTKEVDPFTEDPVQIVDPFAMDDEEDVIPPVVDPVDPFAEDDNEELVPTPVPPVIDPVDPFAEDDDEELVPTPAPPVVDPVDPFAGDDDEEFVPTPVPPVVDPIDPFAGDDDEEPAPIPVPTPAPPVDDSFDPFADEEEMAPVIDTPDPFADEDDDFFDFLN